MFEKDRKALDAFSFSLGGMRTIASFAAAPAIANDRINKIRDERIKQARKDRDREPSGRLQRRRQTA